MTIKRTINPKLRPLTPKQKKFIEGITQGKTGVQSALNAYDTKDNLTARVMASENLTKPNIQNALIPFLNKHNLTIDRALHQIDISLSADSTNQYTGEVTPDYNVRLKASDRALKLLGITQEQGSTISLHLTDKSTTYNL